MNRHLLALAIAAALSTTIAGCSDSDDSDDGDDSDDSDDSEDA